MDSTWLETIKPQLSTDALAFVTANEPTLLQLGSDAVADVLTAINAGDKKTAGDLPAVKLSTAADIDADMDATTQARVAQTTAHETFIAQLEKVGLELLPIIVKLGVTLLCVMLLLLPGCGSDSARRDHIDSSNFVKHMHAGETTRADEQHHAETMNRAFIAQDAALNGSKSAAATEALVNPPPPALSPAVSAPAAPASPAVTSPAVSTAKKGR